MPKILLVEDDSSISMGLKFCLEQEGFDITNVSDGESALKESKENYDLILLDLNLPDMHGFEILKRVKTTLIYIIYKLYYQFYLHLYHKLYYLLILLLMCNLLFLF